MLSVSNKDSVLGNNIYRGTLVVYYKIWGVIERSVIVILVVINQETVIKMDTEFDKLVR